MRPFKFQQFKNNENNKQNFLFLPVLFVTVHNDSPPVSVKQNKSKTQFFQFHMWPFSFFFPLLLPPSSSPFFFPSHPVLESELKVQEW